MEPKNTGMLNSTDFSMCCFNMNMVSVHDCHLPNPSLLHIFKFQIIGHIYWYVVTFVYNFSVTHNQFISLDCTQLTIRDKSTAILVADLKDRWIFVSMMPKMNKERHRIYVSTDRMKCYSNNIWSNDTKYSAKGYNIITFDKNCVTILKMLMIIK
jgi:hypothetical protein